MSWLQLTVQTDAEHANALAEFLEQFGASAISFSATNEEKIFDNVNDQNHELWQATSVSGLLPADVDMDILLVCMRDRLGTGNLFDRSIVAIANEDWVENYQNSQSLLHYKDKLCICPSWIEPPEMDVAPIIIDPGLAFGTGTHATTSLCLEWLADAELKEQSLIDYGCGSGILALAAARLGAGRIYAVDIDPQAIIACEGNAKQNQLSERIDIALVKDIKLPLIDILMANVLLNPLMDLAEHFASLIKANGRLVLSGLLATQIDECLAAYVPWFTMQEPVIKQEWALLEGRRLND